MILCGSLYAQSCMVITGNVLFPNKEACFEDSIKKQIKLLNFPLFFKQNLSAKLYPVLKKVKKKRILKMITRIMTFFKDKGEGTKWDLDYGKLIIIALCVYIALKV